MDSMDETQNPGYWLKKIKKLRYGWQDEMPNKVIHNNSGIKAKARKGWFVAIRAEGDNILEMGWMSEDTKRLYKDYIYLYVTDWINRDTVPSDIEKGNKVLDSIIRDLERVQS